MNVKVLLAPNLPLAVELTPDITVEAEYGSTVVWGRHYTAAHHQPSGPFMGRHLAGGTAPSPCNDTRIPLLETGVILVSHLDLDTVGGVLRALPHARMLFQPTFQSFWDLAEAVDTMGAHKLGAIGASTEDVERLYAWWAWFQAQPRASLDEVTDVTDRVLEAGLVILAILHGDEDLLKAGKKFLAATDKLNADTFVGMEGQVVFRVTPKPFVNHLYVNPYDHIARAVVSFNKETRAITLSFADPEKVSARDIVQGLWGPEAGGHAGIAGSPRGWEMTTQQAMELAQLVDKLLT